MCQSLARSIEKDFPRLLALSQVQVTCSFCPRTLLEMEQMAETRQQRALTACRCPHVALISWWQKEGTCITFCNVPGKPSLLSSSVCLPKTLSQL